MLCVYILLVISCQFTTALVDDEKRASSKILDLVSSMPQLGWMRPILEQKDLQTQRRIIRQWANLILWQTANEAERQDAMKVRAKKKKKP